MSDPYLPPETLDYIVDILRSGPKTLQNCCLVAKSWVPRTRKYLFAEIKLYSVKHLEAWKKTFPYPPNSPAHYTHTLLVRCPHAVTTADAEEGGWIQALSHLVRLDLGENSNSPEVSLAPFYRLPPVLKSLCVSSMLLNPQIFDLVCSLPLLEDLTLAIRGIESEDLDDGSPPALIRPSTSPVLTGTLEIPLLLKMEPLARRLLDLPNGLHFQKLKLEWAREGCLRWINASVVGCSDALESLYVTCYLHGAIVRLLRRIQCLTTVCRLLGTRFD